VRSARIRLEHFFAQIIGGDFAAVGGDKPRETGRIPEIA
jgi:hypothetical protein